MTIGRVRTRRAFDALREHGARARHGAVSVTYVPGDHGVFAAYAVGRATGSAVARNRVRRRLRAAIAELSPAPGTYLVGAGPGAVDLPYQQLRDELGTAITQVTSGRAA